MPGVLPAGAGNTRAPARGFHGTTGHPRGCGEHYCQGGSTMSDVGSSPRVRGTPECRQRDELRAGVIPAGAGNTLPDQEIYVKDRRTSFSPSQSTGCHGPPTERNASPCSVSAVWTMMARPVSPVYLTILVHKWSRTRAVTWPTNTPGEISSSHRVRCPRSPAGTATSTTTVTCCRRRSRHRLAPHRRRRPTARHDRSRRLAWRRCSRGGACGCRLRHVP